MNKTVGSLASVLVVLGLSACGSSPEESTPSETTPLADTSSVAPTTSATPASASASDAATSSAAATTSAAASSAATKTTAASNNDPNIAKAKEIYGRLGPAALFDQFENCRRIGTGDDMQCHGDEVGQFQLFASDARAASATQMLTELRSSRVIEDTGSRVIGWQTLGNAYVLNVVDNDHGLVMQQLFQADEGDPRTRLEELGLLGHDPDAPAGDASSDSASAKNDTSAQGGTAGNSEPHSNK